MTGSPTEALAECCFPMETTADATSERLSAFTGRYPDQLPEAADDTTNG